MALGKASRRFDLLFDPMKLSDALGYDFSQTEHGAELLSSIGPKIAPIDDSSLSSEAVPFLELPGHKSRLVLWSRGHLKTSAVALYIVNLILAYPNIRILLMQSTAKHTRGLLREIKSHFNGENPRSQIAKVFPNWVKKDPRTGNLVRIGTADGFICPARTRTLKEWTVSIAGTKTSKTGQHYDVMFFDDLVTDQNFRNQELQEKLIEDFSHLTPLLEPGGFKTVTGTRYSFGDLYGWIIRNDAVRKEWDISVRTCWKDGDRKNGVLFPQVKTEDGRTIGFTPELLDSIRADNPAIFSCQYLNQPIIAGRALFTDEMLMRAVRAIPGEQITGLGPSTLFVDLASSKSASADKSVVVCGRQFGSQMYVCDIRAGQWDSTLTIAHNVIDMVVRHRPTQVMIEGTAAGKYFIDYLRMVAAGQGVFVRIEPIKVNNQADAKDLRISAIEGVLRNNTLFFLMGLPNWLDLAKMFTQWQPGYRGRHDDEIDTIALMVQHYTQTTDVLVHRPTQTLFHYITRPTPVSLIAERTFVPEESESCGSSFIN